MVRTHACADTRSPESPGSASVSSTITASTAFKSQGESSPTSGAATKTGILIAVVLVSMFITAVVVAAFIYLRVRKGRGRKPQAEQGAPDDSVSPYPRRLGDASTRAGEKMARFLEGTKDRPTRAAPSSSDPRSLASTSDGGLTAASPEPSELAALQDAMRRRGVTIKTLITGLNDDGARAAADLDAPPRYQGTPSTRGGITPTTGTRT